MRQLWDASRRRLIFVGDQATADYWDDLWRTDDLRAEITRGQGSLVVPLTRRYLPPPARLLEGGCGRARFVHALGAAGYRITGLDYAGRTLRRVHGAVPELELVLGDVFHLPVADASLDGYWSLGVIEHFWDGYQPILREAARVLRPGGVLFLTHPALSALRRAKARLGRYPRFCGEAAPDGFYQFALDPRQVAEAAREAGFELLECRPRSGDKGLKDEVAWLRAPLQRLADYRGPSRLARLTRSAVERLARPWAGHTVVHVLRRR